MLMLYFGLVFVINFLHEAQLVNLCGPDEFPCNDGSCVSKDVWCDSNRDCHDESDEDYCYMRSGLISNPNRCNLTRFFLCGDGQCIPSVGRCDGYSSCSDNSDEENCDAEENIPVPIVGQTTQTPLKFIKPELKDNPKASDPHNLMQSDHGLHTEVVTTVHTTEFNVNQTNISDHFTSSSVLKNVDPYQVSEVEVSSNASIFSRNLDNQNSFVSNKTFQIKHKQALEFRDVLGSILNASQNEQNRTKNSNTELKHDSVSLNETSTQSIPKTTEVSNSSNIASNASHYNMFHADQKDSKSSQKPVKMEEDLNKSYVKLSTRDFRKFKERALQWLIDSRKDDYGWGEETARALTAVLMADYSAGKAGDNMIMSKQLHLKLFTLMSRNETKTIPLGELALHINALSASCGNPKNFYGHDLINILRCRTDAAHQGSKFVTPFVYLVLCLNNATSYADVTSVRDMIFDSNITKTDSEAIVSLAATCISRIPKFSTIGFEKIASKKLYKKIKARGLPRNIYELALLTQALNEAKINQDLWNRTEVMRRITESQEKDGSFGDILATYYVVPVLSAKSFLSLGKTCSETNTGLTPLEVLKNGKNEKMYVHYSLLFGNPVEMSQSLMIQVQKNTSFMDTMRIAAAINPTYKFKCDENDGKTTVYSIGGIANDAEKGLYWSPYTSRDTGKEFLPFEGDIKNFVPARDESIAFWRQPVF